MTEDGNIKVQKYVIVDLETHTILKALAAVNKLNIGDIIKKIIKGEKIKWLKENI